MENLTDQTDADAQFAGDAICITICDDETFMLDLLEEKVKKMLPSAVTERFLSGRELLEGSTKADILFLDIQMPEINGMETARLFRKQRRDAIIIFVTADPEYVFQAFDVGAFHYLVKPLEDDKFSEVFGNAVQEIESRKRGSREPDEEYIMIQAGGVHTKILLKDIIYAEVFNRKVIIHTVSGDTEYYGKLSDLEKKTGEDFFRTHRSYLIHFRYVLKYDAMSVVMERGTVLVAKQNYPKFVKQYLKYNQRKGREIK